VLRVLIKRVRIMLRFKVLVSLVPLIAAAILARIEFFPADRPCIAVGFGTVQLATAPWHADLRVSFTDDPARATVRVAVADNAATADFAVIDGADAAEESACAATADTQFVAISSRPSASSPVIFLSHDDGPADYRIFVHSRRFTERDAAALIVGAHGDHRHLAALY
jgi:hypothetical protein